MTRDGEVVERYAYAGPGTGRTYETTTVLATPSHRAYAYDTENHLTSAGAASNHGGSAGPCRGQVAWVGYC